MTKSLKAAGIWPQKFAVHRKIYDLKYEALCIEMGVKIETGDIFEVLTYRSPQRTWFSSTNLISFLKITTNFSHYLDKAGQILMPLILQFNCSHSISASDKWCHILTVDQLLQACVRDMFSGTVEMKALLVNGNWVFSILMIPVDV